MRRALISRQIAATRQLFLFQYRMIPPLNPSSGRITARLTRTMACVALQWRCICVTVCSQVCERLVDSNMCHGASIKMIVESFNAALPQALRNLFKPTSSIQAPFQTSLLSSRPTTAIAVPASSDQGVDMKRPFTAATRPATSYSEAGEQYPELF
jgi:hypothetical protein